MKTQNIKDAFQVALVNKTSMDIWYKQIVPLRMVDIVRYLLPRCTVRDSESPFLGYDKYIVCDLSTTERTHMLLDLVINAQIPAHVIWDAIKPHEDVMPLRNDRVSVEFQMNNRDEEAYDVINPWYATYGDTSDEDSSEPEEDVMFRDLLQTEKILTRFYDVIRATLDVAQVCVEVRQYQGIGFWTHRDE